MKSVVLVSGGLDSTVNLYEAHSQGHNILALHFQYGQRASRGELRSVTQLTQNLGVELITVDLPWFSQAAGASALLNSASKIPQGSDVEIESRQKSLSTAQSVWVPNRNGVFLNIAAAFAEARGFDHVIPGFNAEEASTFPDNSEDFLRALTTSFSYSTANRVSTLCFTTPLNKIEMVQRALALKVPFEDLWPCYQSLESWCGECESCQRFKRGLRTTGIDYSKWFHPANK